MNVRILPSSPGESAPHQFLTTYLVNDRLAVDAGCLGLDFRLDSTSSVRSIFLTHPHVDHVGTLPIFLENQLEVHEDSIHVYGSKTTLQAVREHLFNRRLWVDYAITQHSERPWVRFHIVKPEESVDVDGLRVTAVPVHHAVPTYGYIVQDDSCAVIFGADSGPTTRIWDLARGVRRLRAAFVECSFPDSEMDLAERTGHLTPRLLAAEAGKLPSGVEIIVVHLKPRYRDRILAELAALGDDRLRIGEVEREYAW